MARWYLDTEFHEDGVTIDLISIALVGDNGSSFYATSSEFDGPRCGPWLREHVIPYIHAPHERLSRAEIREEIEALLIGPRSDGSPEIWAYFASYDWVAFCQLFGRMIDLPKGMPMFCRDLKQLMSETGVSRAELPAQEGTQHDALDDARWVKAAHEYILAKQARVGINRPVTRWG